MAKTLTLAYGAVSYVIFFLTFLYAIGFIGNLVVPKSLDSPATDPWQTALLIDLGLLGHGIGDSTPPAPWQRQAN